MEFSSEVLFEATVDSGSLRDARQEAESEFSDTEVTVDVVLGDVDTSSLPSDVGGSQSLPPGGGAGGGTNVDAIIDHQPSESTVTDHWDTEHQLSETRNNLLRELLAEQEQSRYDRASRGLGTAAVAGTAAMAAPILAPLAGLAGLGLGAKELSENVDLPPLEVPHIDPLDVIAPESVPLDYPSSIPLDVPEIDDIGVEKPEWIPLPVADPTGGGSGSGDGTGTTSPAPDGIQDPGPVIGDDPAPIPDGIAQPGPGPADAPAPAPSPTGDGNPFGDLDVPGEEIVMGGLGALSAGAIAKGLSGAARGVGGSAGSLAALPSLIAAQSAQRSQNQPRDQQSWFDRLVGGALEGAGSGGSGTSTAAGAATAGVDASTLAQAIESAMSTTDSGREQSGRTTVEHTAEYNVDFSDLERQMRQDKRELERKMKRLENALGGGV